ncbi:hypothetical protein NQ176_g157 [Zarea fungicola]|uniref:Uncharacterized protein n=1 Tax=Zarea fungicola TaxID=93591 RepID=A0ACC1P0H6_9HYPO|nr:hypothetical protein NQ176_g157 [Lecanicillium fungicola]
MAQAGPAARYNREDLDTASIRSAAPSYVSDVPSYHSTMPNADAVPIYTPTTTRDSSGAALAAEGGPQGGEQYHQPAQAQTIGLPPIPSIRPSRAPQQFGFPTIWSAANTPTARHYRKVAERRVVDGRYQAIDPPRRQNQRTVDRLFEEHNAANEEAFRPLEDPYLVGEQAAAEARKERLSRERLNTSLQQEERHWDWLIAQMRGWEARERSWTRTRGEVDASQRRRLSRRVGQHILSM